MECPDVTTPILKMVTFQDISCILEVTDVLGLNRESIEIPLTPEHPGKIHRLPNGKIEIIVDSNLAFDEWLCTLEASLRRLLGLTHG